MKGIALLLLLFVLCALCLMAQSSRGTSSKPKPYSLVIIADEAHEFDLLQELKVSPYAAEIKIHSFLNTQPYEEITDSLNQMLNRNLRIDKSHFYLMLVGGGTNWREKPILKTPLFADKIFLQTDSSDQKPDGFKQLTLSTLNVDSLLKALKKSRQYTFVVNKIKQANKVDISRKRVKGFGLRTAFQSITSSQTEEDGYLPANYQDFGINYYRYIKNRWRLNVDLGFSFKRPNPQQLIQEQVLSQVDISDIISGGSINEDVEIDLTIIGHFAFQLNTEMYYLLNHQKKFNPYIGAGLGLTNLLAFKGDIDTTINIDISSGGGFDRSALSGDGEEGFDDSDIQQSRLSIPSLNFAFGFQQELGRKISLDFQTKYALDLRSFRASTYANRLSMQAGLLYRLGGKKKIIYKYF